MKRVLIIGRYIKTPIFNSHEYDHVCYVNCRRDRIHEQSSKYTCFVSDGFYNRLKPKNHVACTMYNPTSKEMKIRDMDNELPPSVLIKIKEMFPEIVEKYKNIPNFPLWPTTGIMSVYHYLTSTDYEVHVLGLSHFGLANNVLVPEQGMKDSADKPCNLGRHSVQLEYVIAKHLYETFNKRLIVHPSNIKEPVLLKYLLDCSKARIFIIGDSHNLIFNNMPVNKYMKIRSDTTMSRVCQDGIDKLIDNDCKTPLNIKPSNGDILYLSFGDIDITNVESYVKLIKKYCSTNEMYPIIHVDFVGQPEYLDVQEKIRNELKECCKRNKITTFELRNLNCTGCAKCNDDDLSKIWNKLYNIEINMQ